MYIVEQTNNAYNVSKLPSSVFGVILIAEEFFKKGWKGWKNSTARTVTLKRMTEVLLAGYVSVLFLKTTKKLCVILVVVEKMNFGQFG